MGKLFHCLYRLALDLPNMLTYRSNSSAKVQLIRKIALFKESAAIDKFDPLTTTV